MINLRLMIGLWSGSISKFLSDIFTFWNILDYMRIGSLLFYILIAENDCVNPDMRKNSLAFLTAISWILLLE
jgi:hypothetical protein